MSKNKSWRTKILDRKFLEYNMIHKQISYNLCLLYQFLSAEVIYISAICYSVTFHRNVWPINATVVTLALIGHKASKMGKLVECFNKKQFLSKKGNRYKVDLLSWNEIFSLLKQNIFVFSQKDSHHPELHKIFYFLWTWV